MWMIICSNLVQWAKKEAIVIFDNILDILRVLLKGGGGYVYFSFLIVTSLLTISNKLYQHLTSYYLQNTPISNSSAWLKNHAELGKFMFIFSFFYKAMKFIKRWWKWIQLFKIYFFLQLFWTCISQIRTAALIYRKNKFCGKRGPYNLWTTSL